MKQLTLILFLLLSINSFAKYHCELPKKALLPNHGYQCVDADHVTRWSVVYVNNRIQVYRASNGAGFPVNDLPYTMGNSTASLVYDGYHETLTATVTEDGSGKWIKLLGIAY